MEHKDYLHQDYLIEQWRLAFLDYQLSVTPEQTADALRSLHKLSITASALYGCEFVDNNFLPFDTAIKAMKPCVPLPIGRGEGAQRAKRSQHMRALDLP